VLESLCLLEVAIGLALGDRTTPGQLLGGLGPMLVLLQNGTGQVDPLGLLDLAGTGHLTYKYAYLCQQPSTSSFFHHSWRNLTVVQSGSYLLR
jgi:hypothetical protein